MTPESKIVLALHFIYSYEGIIGNQRQSPYTISKYTGYETVHFHFEDITQTMTKFYDHLFCIYENSSFPYLSIIVFTSLLLPDIKACWLHWAMTPLSALKSWKIPLKTSMHYAENILRSPRNVFFPSDQEWTALSQANYILQTYIAFITFNISLEQAMEVWCVNVLFQEKK